MSNLLTAPGDCCGNTCPDPLVENIPGPQGPQGAAGTNGTNGKNVVTTTTASFVQPAADANVNVTVADSSQLIAGQDLFIGTGGYYLLVSKPDSTHITVKNYGYDENAPPTTVVSSGVSVGPAGLRGVPGTVDTMGALLAVNNLSDVASTATSRTNLGLGTMATENTGSWLSKAGNLSGLANAATARANLGVSIGSQVQAFNALLAALAALSPAGSGNILYTTGSNVFATAAITSYGRSMIAVANALAARSLLGSVLPRYGVIASKTAVDLNSAASDNALTIESTNYRIVGVMVCNASISVTTATVGLFTASGGGGTTLAADQGITALTAASKFKDITLQSICTTDLQTATTLYFRVGTAQGAACVADVYILGESLS